MHIPQTCTQRAHRHPPTGINPQLLAAYIQYQCIYPTLTYSRIVGIIYPIQIYSFLNVYFVNLRPKGTVYTDTLQLIIPQLFAVSIQLLLPLTMTITITITIILHFSQIFTQFCLHCCLERSAKKFVNCKLMSQDSL